MRKLILFLGVLCFTFSAALAGPNAGGVLWVHDTNLFFYDEPPLPPISPPPTFPCPGGVDNQMAADLNWKIWKVYAAFPQESSPRLMSVSWGTQFPEPIGSPYSYVQVLPALCGVPDEDGTGTDVWTGANGFPTASGGEVVQSFPTGPRTTTVVELFYFGGLAYAYGAAYAFPTWCTIPHSNPTNRYFLDDADPPNADLIEGYGCLGFGTPGFTPCPGVTDPAGACCDTATGACMITYEANCPYNWLGPDVPCTPETCPSPPVPTGACCRFDTGSCHISSQAACFYTWLGPDVPCDVTTCPPMPTGACCEFETGHCYVTYEAFCHDTWLGPGVPCNPTTCPPPPPPSGACCNLATGACMILIESECSFSWLGPDVPCNTTTCPPPPEGACCFESGDCAITIESDCSGTEWIGGEVCDPNPCLQPPLNIGGCCDWATGGCTITYEADCPFDWLGQGVPCNTQNCYPPVPVERTSWGKIKNTFR